MYQSFKNYWMVYKFEYLMKLNMMQLLWKFKDVWTCFNKVKGSKWLQIHQEFKKYLRDALWRSSTALKKL